jgi:sugar/nucleoside kinase (ribokinase family)
MAVGTTLNVCRAYQYMTKKSEPQTIIIGMIGKDENGKILSELCAKDNIDCRYFVDDRPNSRTACCLVLVDSNHRERTLITDNGTVSNCKILEKEFYSDTIQRSLQNSLYIFFSGFSLGSIPEIGLFAAQYAAKNNKNFALDLQHLL